MLIAPSIAKKKAISSLITPAIDLNRPERKVLTKGQYVEYKCHSSPGDPDSPVYSLQVPYFSTGSPEEWLLFMDNLNKAIIGQNITTGPSRYEFAERVLKGDALATFRHKTVETGNRTVENFDAVMTKLSAHIFPVHAYREQKRYMRRFLKKPKDWTTREFFSRVQEINNYLQVFPSETADRSTSLPEEELVEALYHAMPNSWRTEMVIQGFNYVHHNCVELLNFCERLETLEPPPEKKKDNKKSSNKSAGTTGNGKRKRISFFSSSEDEGSRKYCMLHGYCRHTTNECEDLKDSVEHLKRKRLVAKKRYHSDRTMHTSGSSGRKNYVNKQEINAMVEKKMKKFLKKKGKKEELHQMDQFKSINLSDDEKEVKSDMELSSSDSDSSDSETF